MPAHGHGHMVTWSWPASHRVMWTLPTLPPTKVLQCKDCKVWGCMAKWLLARGLRVGPGPKGHGSGGATNKIFYCPHCPHCPQIFKFIFWYIRHMFESLPFAPRKVEATEARLTRIYEAAKLGLKGDSLALASGLLPTEYRQLVQLDPIAEMAALKGKADAEMEMSQCLHTAARQGDAKAALAILQNVHGWVAKQSITIDVDQRISITQALRDAESRVIDVIAHEPSSKLELPTHAEHQVQR